MATSTTSVPLVDGPHPDAAALDARVQELRSRFPRAHHRPLPGPAPHPGPRRAGLPGSGAGGRRAPAATTSRSGTTPCCAATWRRSRWSAGSNVQDGSVLHVGDFSPCSVGAETVIGHRVMLHGCRVEDGCIVGMQATILDDAVVGAGSVVGAAALVTPGTRIPPRSLVLGAPARVVRSAGRRRRGLPPGARRQIRPPQRELPAGQRPVPDLIAPRLILATVAPAAILRRHGNRSPARACQQAREPPACAPGVSLTSTARNAR